MEKISKILPPSARTVSVDLKNSGTARSGTPSFGRPKGLSTVARREQALALEKAIGPHKNLMSERVRPGNFAKDPQVEMVDQIATNFFMKKASGSESTKPLVTADDVLGVDFDSDLNPNTINIDAEENLDSPVVGAHLDVQA